MYRMICPCGHEMEVRGSQAGSEVICACGKTRRVPPLSTLKDFQYRNEAAPAISLSGDEQVEQPRQGIQFFHCCGRVGSQGYVSNQAMRHFVELAHRSFGEWLGAIEELEFDELVLAIALSPTGEKRIEFDLVPKSSNAAWLEPLRQKILEIDAPPISEFPVAFAFYVCLKEPMDKGRRLAVFPSLQASIEAIGLEAAICKAFGIAPPPSNPSQPKSLARVPSWWQRLLKRWWPQPRVAAATRTDRELFLEQEQWVARCSQMASETSWIDLKRAIASSPDDPAFRLAFAEKHASQSLWDIAIAWYDGLLRQFPSFAPLLARRAAMHRSTNNSQAALQDLTEAVRLAPHEPSYRVERSFIYIELAAWDQAVIELSEAIRLAPNDPELYFHRAIVRGQLNQSQEAISDLEEAVRLDPNFGHAHFRLGWLYFGLDVDKGESAVHHLSLGLELTQDDLPIRLHRAVVYLSQSKYGLSMEDCHVVLEREPDNAQAHGVLGRALQCDGQFDEAIRACSRAIELGNEYSPVYLARAISYASTDQMNLAAADCETVLALEPDNPLAIQLHGRIMLQNGDLDAAMEAFNRARELAPDWVEPREQLSLAHLLKENPKASVDEQTQLIERQPKQATHYVNRAFAFTQLHEFAKATEDYDRAIELEPENERLYFLRGVFRMNRQLTELALADFERVLEITGGDDSAREHRASLLLKLNRYQEAAEDYAELIAKYPENPHAYSGRAFALAALGNTDGAQKDVERAIEMSPELADGIQRSTQTANVYRLVHAEEYDLALEATNQIISEFPDVSIGYRMRAFVRWEREEYVESFEDYSRVIEMDGPTADCLSSRGQVQAELGEWEQALEDLNTAVEMARQSGQTIVLAYALNGRSLTFAGLEREELSSQDFEESSRLCPTNPWVYYHRGIRKYRLREFAEAKTLLELALELKAPALSKRKKLRAKAALESLAKMHSN